jgi:hypothetical protein
MHCGSGAGLKERSMNYQAVSAATQIRVLDGVLQMLLHALLFSAVLVIALIALLCLCEWRHPSIRFPKRVLRSIERKRTCAAALPLRGDPTVSAPSASLKLAHDE